MRLVLNIGSTRAPQLGIDLSSVLTRIAWAFIRGGLPSLRLGRGLAALLDAAQTTASSRNRRIMQIPARTPTLTATTAMTDRPAPAGASSLGWRVGPQVREAGTGWPSQSAGEDAEYVDIVRMVCGRERPVSTRRVRQIPYAGPDRHRARQAAQVVRHAAPTSRLPRRDRAPERCARRRDRRRAPARCSSRRTGMRVHPEPRCRVQGGGGGKSARELHIAPTCRSSWAPTRRPCRAMVKSRGWRSTSRHGAPARTSTTSWSTR